MQQFVSYLAAYMAAGIFAVVAVQSATFQSHSGSQDYIQVIR
tara:strand:+ start:202 stop:327 length:126 start_codon:yes stop_codon:yes gene_type:complete